MTQRARMLIRRLCLVAMLASGALAKHPPAYAFGGEDWFGLSKAASTTGVGQLQRTAQRLARMTGVEAGATLAARISQEGHWTFFNMAGETFTAANDGELKRGLEILLPDIGERRLQIILTGDSFFDRGTLLSQLPKTAELSLGWGDETFKVTALGSGANIKYLAELKPNLLIELNSEPAVFEAMRQLRRPLERQAFRVLSIEPGGPRKFSSTPRTDRAIGRAEIDAIDPAFLVAAIGGLRRQTAVLVGRLDVDALMVKPAAGPERSVHWGELTAAAVAADVDLLVLKSASAQQPGGRNWLWQRVEVKGLETALGHATLADFFDALGSSTNRLMLTVERPSETRTIMDLRQVSGAISVSSTTAKIGSVLSDAVSGLAGNVAHQGALANFRSAGRQVELDRRLVAFVPSLIQWVYGGLFLVGGLGLPLSWRWWSRLWPAEKAAEYSNAFGYWAARAVRGLIYGLIFMPLSAVVAAPLTILMALGRLFTRSSSVSDAKV